MTNLGIGASASTSLSLNQRQSLIPTLRRIDPIGINAVRQLEVSGEYCGVREGEFDLGVVLKGRIGSYAKSEDVLFAEVMDLLPYHGAEPAVLSNVWLRIGRIIVCSHGTVGSCEEVFSVRGR